MCFKGLIFFFRETVEETGYKITLEEHKHCRGAFKMTDRRGRSTLFSFIDVERPEEIDLSYSVNGETKKLVWLKPEELRDPQVYKKCTNQVKRFFRHVSENASNYFKASKTRSIEFSEKVDRSSEAYRSFERKLGRPAEQVRREAVENQMRGQVSGQRNRQSRW